MYWSEFTDFKEIYKDVYWGCFSLRRGAEPNFKIIKNRNNFVYDYKIVRNIKIKANHDFLFPELDHCEAYKTSDNKIVFINSSHLNIDQKAFSLGFIKIYTMYSSTTNTYLKIFKTPKEMNKFLENYKNEK